MSLLELTNINKNKSINLVKPAKFIFFNEVVRIHIPLPKITCSNWNDWEDRNVGIIYKGIQVTIAQMKDMINTFEGAQTEYVNELTKRSFTFDGFIPTWKDINNMKRIIDKVNKSRVEFSYKLSGNHYESSRRFKQETKVII